MRGFIIFVCGVLFGLLVETDKADDSNANTVALNKVGIAVNDVEVSLAFYTEIMGFELVSSLQGEEAQAGPVYLKAGDNAMLELNPVSEFVPPGLLYMGIQVEDLESFKAMYESSGARLRETRRAGTQSVLSYIVDPQGVPIQLSEYIPDSAQSDALAGE